MVKNIANVTILQIRKFAFLENLGVKNKLIKAVKIAP
jgi:hypothetical protein